jgi:hypothetical protein
MPAASSAISMRRRGPDVAIVTRTVQAWPGGAASTEFETYS